ncbi:LOW QUALITY PROTEIN: hypothetical protein RJ639_043687 [Escallonia herrerae]|uniref:Transposase (putative) gypsy type domain-containing protein n=1 Tax=Escallonia herrerae TaxID=1293975 RepID=A0AA89B8M5_9ASTE|nr:LOW QUALITY PROTEIN: hypothetical protein RJ639_043687 [Escallonia herrerae]
MFERDSVRTEFCSPLSLCSGRVFGRDSVLPFGTLLGQSVRERFCSGRTLLGRLAPYSGRVSGDDSDWAEPSSTVWHSAWADTTSFCSFLGLENMSEYSVSVYSPEENVVISSSSSSRLDRVLTLSSEVGTSNPQLRQPSSSEQLPPSSSQPPQPSISQPSPSLPAKNALGDDQAEDEANPKPWYTADEKSSKMSTEDLVELLWEYPLLPGLQEPANYGTKYETGIYEEQGKSRYRLPLHPFALRLFEHYHMAPGQLVPNGWRKFVGLIYLVQTFGYKPDATDFMRVFFEICFVKGVANCPEWYYIHSRQRLLKGGPKSNKGWHSRYFFVGRSDKGKLPFDREWNPYCKDFENLDKLAPNNLTKHILSHIKLRGGLSIDEPLSEQQLEWARIIPRMPAPAGAITPPAPTISSTFPAESASLGVL